MVGVRVIVWVVSLLCFLAAYRWTYQRSKLLAGILTIGVLGRAVLGAALLIISTLGLPVLKSLQMGSGFWTLALDARFYFDTAAAAAHTGLGTINSAAPSPAYLRALAAWLYVAGITPASAVLFNLLCYLAVAIVIIAAGRSAVWGALALVAFTIDPALVLFGTQVLKDSFCVLALALSVAGMRIWCDGLDSSRQHPPARTAAGVLLITASVYVVAGIRPYVVVFMLTALVAAAVVSLAAPQGLPRWRIAVGYTVMILSMWGVFAVGAGAYFPYYEAIAESASVDPLLPLLDLDQARAGFVSTGGGTALAEPSPPSLKGTSGPEAFDLHAGILTRGGRLLLGAAAFVVPITVLRAVSVVHFSGGRGLLPFTDLDTVVVDVLLLSCAFVFTRRRVPPAMMPLVAFAIVLSLSTTVVLAYVVTNFGTLFRLRLLAFCPIWLLPALVRRVSPHTVLAGEAV
jgi:hypothetical protein